MDFFIFLFLVVCVVFEYIALNLSQEVLLQGHTRGLLLVQVGPTLRAAITVKLEHQGIAVMPMVIK